MASIGTAAQLKTAWKIKNSNTLCFKFKDSYSIKNSNILCFSYTNNYCNPEFKFFAKDDTYCKINRYINVNCYILSYIDCNNYI